MSLRFPGIGVNNLAQRRKLIEECGFTDDDSDGDSNKEMSAAARLRKAQKVAIKKKIMECVLADCKDLAKLKNEEIV